MYIVYNDELKVIGETVKVKLVMASSSSRVKFSDGTTDLPALPTDEAAIHQEITVYAPS